ncbi:MAG: EAL domain-containing protein [Frankiaceae bacterium]|nr:EAL domain-containing protein [Frankiaceae bacterium]MBV9869459.1 EAL domain-containing protein [Frankiaceae bacterium]
MADVADNPFPGRASELARASAALMGAVGDVAAIADVLVASAVDSTRANAAAMFQLRGGHWIRIAVAGAAERPISFPLPLAEAPVHPILVANTSRDRHPMSVAARAFKTPGYGIVPMPQWPGGDVLLAISSAAADELQFEDLSVVSMLSITASVAAHRSPVDPERAAGAVEWLAWHQQMLEGIARGVSLDETLRRVCLEVEARYRGCRCSVLLADRSDGVLRHAAGPSLPREFREAIDGLPIRDGVGACGTAAATLRPVVVEDTLTDPKTAAFLDVAKQHKLRSVWSFPLLDAQNAVVGTFALYRDHPYAPDAEEMAGVASLAGIAGLAIERFRTERALTEAAQRDPLTSLANRSMFNHLLAYALNYSRQSLSACAVMLLDLDGFKFVNDSLGHAAGDRLLVAVADRLRLLLPEGCTLARFGGDEFVILVEDATLQLTHRIADAIDAALLDPFMLDGGEFFFTTAIGIALSDGGTSDPDKVIRDADAAMFAAKGRGPGRRAVFDTALRDRATARVAMESELRRAIREHSLRVVYQPLLHIASRKWCGAEALLRWDHSELGAVSPADFVPLAEELGLVGQLGSHVLEAALAQAKAWEAAGVGVPIAVNVSPTQLSDPGVVDEVLGALRRSGVRSDLIYLEITESAVMESPDIAKKLLMELRDAGVRAVIDDFGTGHSSIARLSELPVSGVKIDKSFLSNLGSDRSAARIVAAVIDLAHAFGLTVTAEGVESPSALRVLEDLDCDQAQGYLFGRPGTPDQVAELLATFPRQYDASRTPGRA